MVLHNVQAPPHGGPFPGPSLEDKVKEILPMGRTVHFALMEKWPAVQLHTESWVVANELATWSGTWREHVRKLVTRSGKVEFG